MQNEKKKIIFPLTSNIHWSRNQLLLEELKNSFDVHLCFYSEKEMSMVDISKDITQKFPKALDHIKPDLVLIRADRFELLPCAMLSVYGGYKVAQLEAGDLSGVVDNKVRFAISALADFHFTTNEDSQNRMLSMGFKNVWNCGSLDCEYALSVKPQNAIRKKYLMVLYHSIPNEPPGAVVEAVEAFKKDHDIVGVRGNKDYGIESSYKEWYSPEEFINLLRGASCLIGNSSAGLKEASVLGTPVVNVGDRQKNRLRPPNVIDVACEKELIKFGIEYQFKHGGYEPSDVYGSKDVSKKISEIISQVI